MESATTMLGVSFGQKPRRGQLEVFNHISTKNSLNIQLPTGYGKTATMFGVYAILRNQGRVNRLLVILPTDAQLEQLEKDGRHDMANINLPGAHQIIDIRFFGAKAIARHRNNEAQIFAITVQSLIEARGMDNCIALTASGQWMICVDEYHHYGNDKSWSKSVLALNRQYLLAMSATPSRREDDSAFGIPEVRTRYRSAAEDEGVLKTLIGHAYNYKIDAIDKNGDVRSYTTRELVKEAGSDSPDKIEKYRIKREMRWSPKYVSPLISIPIERMLAQRTATGYPLQALVVAMCVSHAEIICNQLKTMFPELRIDWVGTGEHGRSKEKNDEIIKKFLPDKDESGNRPPAELDVLVNVGIAGEGLDTICVSEIIHLNNASICNRTNQINGRAARYLEGVTGNINFDASSEFAAKRYTGAAIMDAMDYEPPSENEHPDDCDCPLCQKKQRDLERLPEEPNIRIFDMELIAIDSGDIGVQRMAKVLKTEGLKRDWDAILLDRDHPEWINTIIPAFQKMRSIEAAPHNEKAIIKQWDEAVNNAVRVVTGQVIRLMMPGVAFEKSLVGDIKKKINFRKKYEIGAISNDVEVLKKHYRWIKRLEEDVVNRRLPIWLE